MRFDQAAIREIHARIDIAQFIGQYVQLRKRGNDLIGLCPFHSERTPSFHVHPDRGFFKCFGCGAGGDIISFLQKHEQLDFPDAVRVLAEAAGVELAPEDAQITRMRGERQAIYEANRLAAAFFARMLAEDLGSRARQYCQQRGLLPETLERFTLGYAPDRWDGLTEELRGAGVDPALAARAGLLKAGQRGYYDFYRDRLMIPTLATTGETIAFGGRALGPAEPKYLNTATTPVYTKGHHLFALNVARRAAARDRTLIVVEGYLDCIALHQAGIENTVASLGTSFTAEQAAQLRKYADRVYLCFDGDAAGSAAAGKAIQTAGTFVAEAGLSVRVVVLPPGEDPDSFVRARGAAAFVDLLSTSKSALEFRLDPQIDELQRFESPAIIARKAEALIRELAPREEWDRWRVYVAGRLKVNPDDLRNSRFFANGANFAPRAGTSAASRHAPASAQSVSFEREVLAIVLEAPALAAEYGTSIAPARFRNEVYRRIYSRIVEEADRLGDTGDVFALFGDDPAATEVLVELGRRDRSATARYPDGGQRRLHLEQVVARLQLEDVRARYQELSLRIDELVTAGAPVPTDLRSEYDALVAKLKK
ncbi:MAG: DNA primase [Vulcanimicrobiaceae bacterium]